MKFTLDLSLVSAGQDLGGELEEKSPVMAQYGTHDAENYHDDEEFRVGDEYQPAPSTDAWPAATLPDYINVTMSDAGEAQDRYMDPFAWSAGGEMLPDSLQIPPAWHSWAPTYDSDNPHLRDMLSGHLMVDSDDIDNLVADVDRTLPNPYFDASQASMTHVDFHCMNLLIPDQSARQVPSFDQQFATYYTGSNSPAQVFGTAPQVPPFPPAQLQRNMAAEQGSAPENAFTSIAAEDRVPSHTMYRSGPERLPVEAQPPETNTNQTTPFQCPKCGKVLCNLAGLRKHSQTHTNRVNRHVCKVPGCGRSFRDPKDLKRHGPTHDESLIRKVYCEEEGCRQEYRRRDHLLRHVRAKHPDSSKIPDNSHGRVSAPPNSSEKKSRKSKKSESKVGAAKRLSKSRGTPSLVSREQSVGTTLSDQRLLPAYGASASTAAYSLSFLTPDGAE